MPQSKIYFICDNPDCDLAAHQIENPFEAVVLSIMGKVVFNLSGDIDEMPDADIRKELEEQADKARAADATEYADHITAFIADNLQQEQEPKEPEEDQDMKVGCSEVPGFYSSKEYEQMQLETMRTENYLRKAEAKKALAEARLIHAQAEQLELKLPTRNHKAESDTI